MSSFTGREGGREGEGGVRSRGHSLCWRCVHLLPFFSVLYVFFPSFFYFVDFNFTGSTDGSNGLIDFMKANRFKQACWAQSYN